MAQATAARPASPAAVVTAPALLLSLQPVAADLYLPALPALSRALGANIAATQLRLVSPVLGMAGTIAVMAVAWTLVRRHGEPLAVSPARP